MQVRALVRAVALKAVRDPRHVGTDLPPRALREAWLGRRRRRPRGAVRPLRPSPFAISLAQLGEQRRLLGASACKTLLLG